MTSMISRSDLEDQLYKFTGGRKSYAEIRVFMKAIDNYAVSVSRRLGAGQDEEWSFDKWAHLKPGETDGNAGMRRCASCGKVRNLYGAFEKEARAPYGRRLRCTDCRQPRWRRDNTGKPRPDRYWCRRCRTYKPISAFPEEKRKDARKLYHCLDCQGEGKSGL